MREYFAVQIKQRNPDAWREAHARLYRYLRRTPVDFAAITLHRSVPPESMDPFYEAIVHACNAGQYEEAYACYEDFILRGRQLYSWRVLGSYSSDLEALTLLFVSPWLKPQPALTKDKVASIVFCVANCLRRLGRVNESLESIEACIQSNKDNMPGVEIIILKLLASDIHATLGNLEDAKKAALDALKMADAVVFAPQSVASRATLAELEAVSGRIPEARASFAEAEQMLLGQNTGLKVLDSKQGYEYCRTLLEDVRRDCWRVTLGADPQLSIFAMELIEPVVARARTMLNWARNPGFPSEIALCNLALGEAELYRTIYQRLDAGLAEASYGQPASILDEAVARLRRSGLQDELPSALLASAWLRVLEDEAPSATTYLDEAWDISSRGPMRLHMTDIHLYRARLFRDKDELKRARLSIEKCGYWRRKGELEDAERAAALW